MPADSSWHHWAIVKEGTNVKIYRDGVLRNTIAGISSMDPTSGNLQIGTWAATDVETDQIDEFRVSKGIARWTENFTPPAAPYTQIGYGISGNLAEESKIFVLRHSDRLLLHEETAPAGDYEIELNETDNIDVVAEPTGDGAPAVYTNVTPVLL
jgi:hypothetical protein